MSKMLSETETHLNMVADDRGIWHVYSDDPIMQKRLEAAEATLVGEKGDAKWYTLRSDQVVIRKGKRQVNEEQRQLLKERLANINQKRRQFIENSRKKVEAAGDENAKQ